jgi:hypothetical protein
MILDVDLEARYQRCGLMREAPDSQRELKQEQGDPEAEPHTCECLLVSESQLARFRKSRECDAKQDGIRTASG